jgi:hypothetical protein
LDIDTDSDQEPFDVQKKYIPRIGLLMVYGRSPSGRTSGPGLLRTPSESAYLLRYVLTPSTFDDSILKPCFEARTLMKPLTEWACHLKVFIISGKLAPPARDNSFTASSRTVLPLTPANVAAPLECILCVTGQHNGDPGEGEIMPAYTRREWGKLALVSVPGAASFLGLQPAVAGPAAKPSSTWAGVQVGMNVPYNFGTRTTVSAEDVLEKCIQLGVGSR